MLFYALAFAAAETWAVAFQLSYGEEYHQIQYGGGFKHALVILIVEKTQGQNTCQQTVSFQHSPQMHLVENYT